MQKLVMIAFFVFAGISSGYACGSMHSAGGLLPTVNPPILTSSTSGSPAPANPSTNPSGPPNLTPGGLMSPANPSVPPTLASDPQLIGSAPLPPHHPLTSAELSSLNDVSLAPDAEELRWIKSSRVSAKAADAFSHSLVRSMDGVASCATAETIEFRARRATKSEA
jgi:hypothetical protein